MAGTAPGSLLPPVQRRLGEGSRPPNALGPNAPLVKQGRCCRAAARARTAPRGAGRHTKHVCISVSDCRCGRFTSACGERGRREERFAENACLPGCVSAGGQSV
eukprot:5133728-Prymnesium_polylepis.1